MHPPTLADLPPPPPGKTGWPWDQAPAPLPPTLPDGARWPHISIVTPSFNQGEYLEETLRSVLLQGYPNLEYFVFDGGSTDASVAILERYAPWLTYWISAPDHGQADAIAQGFARASGELINWLNSDDLYTPGALAVMGEAAQTHPGQLLAGAVVNFTPDGRERVIRQAGLTAEHLVAYWTGQYRWHQPGLFFPRQAYEACGGLDPTLHYTMDYDLLCRFLLGGIPVCYVPDLLTRFRLHSSSKTCAHVARMAAETSRVSQRYWPQVEAVEVAAHDAYLTGEMLRAALHQALKGAPRAGLAAFLRFRTETIAGRKRPSLLPALMRYLYLRMQRWAFKGIDDGTRAIR
jgi:GT2 family glycosyltransferase